METTRPELSGFATAAEAPEIVRAPQGEAVRRGQVVAGRYEILDRLGAGGMGSVWRAHDRALDEQVALKVIQPALLGDPRALSRLCDEVKLARRITHPNVCRVFDLGEDGALTFLTMELVEGATLRRLLAEGPIEPARALDLLQEIVAGVSAAHAQGIIHRDLKPENVLIRRDGGAVVADFGLAFGPEGGRGAGAVAGTPAYMSPEQRRGEPLDARSDVFALGIVGFELFGEPGEAGRPAPSGAPDPRISNAVRGVLERALSERPEDRYPSAAALGEALARTRGAATPRPAGRGGLWAALVIAGLAALGAGWAFSARGRGAAARSHGQAAAVPEPAAAVAAAATRPVVSVLPFANLTGDPAWDGLAAGAAESVRAGLRTMDEVQVAGGEGAGPGAALVVRGSVQRVGAGLRLFLQLEPGPEAGELRGAEPAEIDAAPGDLAPALEELRLRAIDEARLSARQIQKRRRAMAGMSSEIGRAKLLQFHALTGPAPRPEQFEVGLRLLDEAIAADPAGAPALVERMYLRAMGAGGGPSSARMVGALSDVERARAAAPDDPEVAVARCRLLQVAVEAGGSPRDAMIDAASGACREALLAAPASPHVHIALARIHDRRCEDDDAMRALERAVELDRTLSGRALTHLVGLALGNDRVLLAERMSARLVAFHEGELRLGPRAVSRRAGAPEVSGVFVLRGAALLRIDRHEEAHEAFARELAELGGRGDDWAEAAAIRGMERAAAGRGEPRNAALRRRLAEIEADYRARAAKDPGAGKTMATAYLLVDPGAAAQWIAAAGAPRDCEEALYRARIHAAAGQPQEAREALQACRPEQEWERRCVAQLTAWASR
ncbi:MAG: protein kinase [Polyangiaceae bacterium]|nr:protein kinase [Polyangiaceae bacterium]